MGVGFDGLFATSGTDFQNPYISSFDMSNKMVDIPSFDMSNKMVDIPSFDMSNKMVNTSSDRKQTNNGDAEVLNLRPWMMYPAISNPVSGVIYKTNNNGLWLEEFPVKSMEWKMAESRGESAGAIDFMLPEIQPAMIQWPSLCDTGGYHKMLSKEHLHMHRNEIMQDTTSAVRPSIKGREKEEEEEEAIMFSFEFTPGDDSGLSSTENEGTVSDGWSYEIDPDETIKESFDDISILTEDTFESEESERIEFEETKRRNVLLAVQDVTLTDFLVGLC